MGQIVAIFNQKGGVGKTTTTINLAACLSALGKRVLLVDIDPQGNTTSGLGIDKRALETSLYNVLSDEKQNPADTVLGTNLENLYIIPASIDLAGAEVELVKLSARERRLKNALDKIKTDYDFVFIDCPPSLGLLTLNALTAADGVLIPLQCEFYALEGVSQLMNTIALVQRGLNPALRIEGVLLSMFDARTNLAFQVVEEVRNYFKGSVYETVIPRNIKLAEAPGFGMAITEYDPHSKGAEAYGAFAKEFLVRAAKNERNSKR